MARTWKAIVVALLAAGAVGCDDFLEGGELSTDPNRPTTATSRQLFVGAQTALWNLYAGDMVRIPELWAQHALGNTQQYQQYYRYDIDEGTTNQSQSGLYERGGLVDIRRLQESAIAEDDSVFLGVGQVMEALLMLAGADLFGDLPYSQALKPEEVPNPPLDEQLDIYDQLQTLLDQAIVNLAATGPTNVGPGEADLSYGGDPTLWTKLAHTLKARIHLHTAEVRPDVYPQVLAEAQLGITDPSEDWVASFSGGSGEQNNWYQFLVVQREGYWVPHPDFVDTLEQRNDPRRLEYFDASGTNLSDELLSPAHTQPLVKAQDNLLVIAEAAFRTGNEPVALASLNEARANAGLPAVSLSGQPLLREILGQKYIVTFQTIEGWNDYKRNCYPNLTPVIPGLVVRARLFYDTSERQTNSSYPPPDQQPVRNDNDPPNETDPFGAPCLGQ